MNILDYIATHPGKSTGAISRAMSAYGLVSLSDIWDELHRLDDAGVIFKFSGGWYIRETGEET